jgi:hypothetical protein
MALICKEFDRLLGEYTLPTIVGPTWGVFYIGYVASEVPCEQKEWQHRDTPQNHHVGAQDSPQLFAQKIVREPWHVLG